MAAKQSLVPTQAYAPEGKTHCPFALFSRSKPKVWIHQTIEDVPGDIWDSVVGSKSFFLQRPYLRSVEAGSQQKFRYAVFVEDGVPIGVACFQITDFVGKAIGPLLSKKNAVLSFMAGLLGLTKPQVRFKVIVCGNATTSGEHGFAFAGEVPAELAMSTLLLAVTQIQREQDQQGGYTAVLFKEFYPCSEPVVGLLKNHAYSDFWAGHNMVLMLDPTWKDFDDYLNSLSSKYRVKAKRAYAKSAGIVVRDLTEDDLIRHQDRVEALYHSVLQRADYRLGQFDIASLVSLRRDLGEEFVVKGYYLEQTLVGFLTGFVADGSLEAHLVGFDYGLNHRHSIYPRMLYDYLQIALTRGISRVNYGRTASEIKSTVGAVGVPMKCYLRHNKKTLNTLLPFVSKALQPPGFAQRRPFKKAWYALHQAQ